MTRSAQKRKRKPGPAGGAARPAQGGADKARPAGGQPRAPRRPLLARASFVCVLAAGAAVAWSYPAMENLAARHAWSGAAGGADVTAATMPVCGWSRRVNCVVDGDTVWLDGEKIRLSNIDAPEVEGECPEERKLAARATYRLSTLLSGQAIQVARSGHDAYGRTLATIRTPNGDAGRLLIREGLARPWGGRRLAWCGA